MDNEIITLAKNGLKPEGGGSSEDSAGSSASHTPPPRPRTHDTTPSLYHLKDLKVFARRLEAAAKATLPKQFARPRYQEVEVILMRWQDDDRLGVSCELEDLEKVFAWSYGFSTTEWLIPTENPLVDIMTKVLALVNQPGLEDKLLIIYYAGHAAMNEARQQIWLRTGHWDQGSLEWFAVQPLLVNAKADVLFLLDCCAAASAAAPSNTTVGVKETIGACAFEARAPEPGAFSFTNTLIEVLDAWKERPMFSAAMLHSELLDRLKHPRRQKDRYGNMAEFRRSPVYVVTTTDPKAVSIELGRRILPKLDDPKVDQSSLKSTYDTHVDDAPATILDLDSPPASPFSSPEESSIHLPVREQDSYKKRKLNDVLPDGDLAVPHVLISLTLEGERLLDFGAWKRWIEDCPQFASCAKIEGIYKSHSTLVILSVPVVIWDWLPDDLACSFIGYVGSVNHAKDSSWTASWGIRAWLESTTDPVQMWRLLSTVNGYTPIQDGPLWGPRFDLPAQRRVPNVSRSPSRGRSTSRASSGAASNKADYGSDTFSDHSRSQSFASISVAASLPSPPGSDDGIEADLLPQSAQRASPSPPRTPPEMADPKE